MKPLLRLLAKLYPGPWKKRYGTEFSALLDDAPAGWTTPLDILKGALQMQMRTSISLKVIGVTAAAGALIALAVSFALPKTYESAAVLAIKSAAGPSIPGAVLDLARQAENPDALLAIVRKEGLYTREQAQSPSDLLEKMRKGIRVMPVSGTPMFFRVQFAYGEPGVAQRVTQDLTSMFIRAANAAQGVQVLAVSALPETPVGPKRPAITAAGLVLGCALGAILAALIRGRVAGRTAES